MPGYSGTPLPKKLGIKEGLRVRLLAMPPEVLAELKASLAGCQIAFDGKKPVDVMMWFTKSRADLEEFDQLAEQIATAGMLWVCWPKKSSGVATDLNENFVRDMGLATGLVDVKVCAVTEIWSGLKFVRRLKDR
jgi:hypothetical protein